SALSLRSSRGIPSPHGKCSSRMIPSPLPSADPGLPRPRLPDRLKLLYVTTLHRSGQWLIEAFAADAATRVTLEEAVGVTAGLGLLRDEVFEAVLVSHEPGLLDALDFVEALRTGGHEEPM